MARDPGLFCSLPIGTLTLVSFSFPWLILSHCFLRFSSYSLGTQLGEDARVCVHLQRDLEPVPQPPLQFLAQSRWPVGVDERNESVNEELTQSRHVNHELCSLLNTGPGHEMWILGFT